MTLTYDGLSRFLSEELAVDTKTIDRDTPLFSSGLIDSFSLVSLMAYLEKESGILIEPADIELKNFDTLGRILAYAGAGAP